MSSHHPPAQFSLYLHKSGQIHFISFCKAKTLERATIINFRRNFFSGTNLKDVYLSGFSDLASENYDIKGVSSLFRQKERPRESNKNIAT